MNSHRVSASPLALVASLALLLASLAGCVSENLTPANAPTSGAPAFTPTAAAPMATATRLPPATTGAVALSLGPGVHDFTLPDAHGGEVTLSQHLGEKVVVLTFYRAWW